MRRLFEISPKLQFLNFFGAFLDLKGEFGQKRCTVVCSYVSGTTWTNFLHKS